MFGLENLNDCLAGRHAFAFDHLTPENCGNAFTLVGGVRRQFWCGTTFTDAQIVHHRASRGVPKMVPKQPQDMSMTGTDRPCSPVDMLLAVAGKLFRRSVRLVATVPSRTAMQVTHPTRGRRADPGWPVTAPSGPMR